VLWDRARARPGHTRGRDGLVSEVLRVNPIACTGHGVCAELLPELIGMDPWGYPIVPRGELDDELVDLARKAVAACPVLALTLQKR